MASDVKRAHGYFSRVVLLFDFPSFVVPRVDVAPRPNVVVTGWSEDSRDHFGFRLRERFKLWLQNFKGDAPNTYLTVCLGRHAAVETVARIAHARSTTTPLDPSRSRACATP